MSVLFASGGKMYSVLERDKISQQEERQLKELTGKEACNYSY